MPDQYQQEITWERLFPRIQKHFKRDSNKNKAAWATYYERMESNYPRLFELYYRLYGSQYDFYFHLEDLLISITESWKKRTEDLKELDNNRAKDPLWFQSHQMLGGVCYVDLFAGDLEGIRKKIP